MVDKLIFDLLGWFSAGILILGSLLNGLMCVVLIKNPSMLSNDHILLLSMAVSDFLCCVVAIPTAMISNFHGKWMFGDSGCTGHAFAVTWFGTVSITHLATLAFCKYRSMKFQHNQMMLNKKTWYLLALALWFYSFIFAFAPMVGWSKYTKEGLGTSCSVDWQASDIKGVSYTIFLFVGCFVLPVTIILFSYFKISVEIRTMVRKAKITWGRVSHQTKQTLKSEKKMAVLFFMMIMAFLVAWTPYSVVSLISAAGRSSWIGPVAASLPAYLAKSSNLFNPVLYFLLYKRFRVKVLDLFWITCLRRKTKTKYGWAAETRKKEKIELKT